MAEANCCFSQKVVVLPGLLYVCNHVSYIVMHVFILSLVYHICLLHELTQDVRHTWCDAYMWKVSAGCRSVQSADAALVAVVAAVAFFFLHLSLPWS